MVSTLGHFRQHKPRGTQLDNTNYDLVGCLEDLAPVQDDSPTHVVHVVMVDGAAIVNMRQTGFCKDIF